MQASYTSGAARTEFRIRAESPQQAREIAARMGAELIENGHALHGRRGPREAGMFGAACSKPLQGCVEQAA